MNKLKVPYLVVVFALFVVSVVMFSGIAQAGAVPDGFAGVPWGASKDQIIKTMNEQGYRQITCEEGDSLCFRGSFLSVTCIKLIFSLHSNSFCSGFAVGCARSEYHRPTQRTFEEMVNILSEKYGPPQSRQSGKTENPNCAGCPTELAGWDFVDSRSDKYRISIRLEPSSFYYTNEEKKRRVDILIWYEAESLRKRLEKKEY